MYVFRTVFTKEKADRILHEFGDVCKLLGIDFYVVFGTCLGFYRDKGYIDGDKDLDLMPVCSDAKFVNLIHTLQLRGYVWRLGVSGMRFYGHAFKNDILLDIWREHNDLLGRLDLKRLQTFYRSHETVEYNGRTYWTPTPIVGYLEFLYGKGWVNPIRRNK